MNAEEARKKAEEARAIRTDPPRAVDLMSIEEVLKLISAAASEGKTTVTLRRTISRETEDELTRLGYWVVYRNGQVELRFED
jgi:ABC-type histidine transport system ATPase subunit